MSSPRPAPGTHATNGQQSRLAPANGLPSATPGEPLSTREFEVLCLLRDGFSYEGIGRKLAITERTARAHVAAIKDKLDAATAAQCVARGFEWGLLQTSPAGG